LPLGQLMLAAGYEVKAPMLHHPQRVPRISAGRRATSRESRR
jgi:hypothetical protein